MRGYRIRDMGASDNSGYRPDLTRSEFERLMAAAVPGEMKGRFVGAKDNVLIHSILETEAGVEHCVTYLELPTDDEDPEAFEQRMSVGYVPPTGLGVAIRYQHCYPEAFLAGTAFQQLATAIKHEIDHDEGDEPVIGREFIERKLQNEADRRLAKLAQEYEQKAAEHPELAEELEERLQEQIPDDEKREFLRSLYSFTAAYTEDEPAPEQDKDR